MIQERRKRAGLAAALMIVLTMDAVPAEAQVPAARDFPEYRVPGHEAAMERLRALHRLHYGPRTATTLWDAWLPMASLWPGVGPQGNADEMRAFYRAALLGRKIDAEGYVATQQHRGLAHADGWPFPTWPQSGGAGWHFSMAGDGYALSLGLRPTTTLDGWALEGLEPLGIDPALGARFRLSAPVATLITPAIQVAAIVSPFMKVEWAVQEGEGAKVQPALEWATVKEPLFAEAHRVNFPALVSSDGMQVAMVRLDRQPGWGEPLVKLRLRLEGPVGTEVVLKALHTAIDTRHPTNNSVYLQACVDYFDWTTDVDFLRSNIERMRRALQYALDEFDVRARKGVVVPWTGHDGRSGLVVGADGSKQMRAGQGVGNNYWDLLPFGGQDALATIYLHAALGRMAAVERQIEAHPAWGIGGTGRVAPADLEALAAAIRAEAGARFWNPLTGRFVGWIDADGKAYDYGLTTLNEEAIVYGFATPEQARSILDWIDGKRLVAGDTSTGADLYRWRFAPRCTTRRNVETYVWAWSAPEAIPWGDQVQDGGAVLGWSYFDLMARLEVNGPDDAWNRLHAILDWFAEVQAAGGYRTYYGVKGRGSLQGAGTPGGLGLDAEFLESVLVPQVMVYGFLGLKPRPGGFAIAPRLPRNWPELAVTNVHVQGRVVDVKVKEGAIEVRSVGGTGALEVGVGPGRWRVEEVKGDGAVVGAVWEVEITPGGAGIALDFEGHDRARLTRAGGE